MDDFAVYAPAEVEEPVLDYSVDAGIGDQRQR